MSKTSVLNRPKVDHSQSRNGFDRSSRMSFNMSCGMLLPLDWRPVTAGSKVKLNRKVFLRTSDVNTAAFTPFDFHVEYFKVPLRLLWSFWNDFKLGIQDINSTALFGTYGKDFTANTERMPAGAPMFDINRFHTKLAENLEQNPTLNYGTNPSDEYTGYKDSMGFLYTNGFYRLRDMFRYGGSSYMSNTFISNAGETTWPQFLVSPFPALAYQKIYYDHFRNTAYESNDPYAYNLDWLSSGNQIDLDDEEIWTIARKWFNLRYVNYRNDYYKNIYPALNYVSSSPSGSSWNIPNNIQGLDNNPINSSSNGGRVLVSPNFLSSADGIWASRPVTVQNIRAAFALDKLLRASAYAPKHVQDQFKARFGVTISDKVSNESERLGSFMCDVKLMEVTSSADTQVGDSITRLGSIGAKGIGVGDTQKTIETYCEEDCIIMSVGYVLPRTSYDAYGCDQWLTKINREEFFQPEFENLGLEPVYGWELNRRDSWQSTINGYNNYVYGYRPRNQVYKLSQDLNHGEFRAMNPQIRGVLNESELVYNLVGDLGKDTLESYVVHSNLNRREFGTPLTSGLNYQYFKVSPMDVNSIFLSQYNVIGSQVEDQFFGYMENIMPTIQNMSVHGQPHL